MREIRRPTRKEIARRCRDVQALWTEHIEQKRRQTTRQWELPIIRDPLVNGSEGCFLDDDELAELELEQKFFEVDEPDDVNL